MEDRIKEQRGCLKVETWDGWEKKKENKTKPDLRWLGKQKAKQTKKRKEKKKR